MEYVQSFQLNYRNIHGAHVQGLRSFGAIRFDSNNDCNVHCVYCHNHRSPDLVEPEDFRMFLADHVAQVREFQVGCGMEPTLDPRMCDFLDIVAQSSFQPASFRLQTNGILLHRHDLERIKAAGLTHLSVSVDSSSQSTHKDLRGGTSLAKVEGNLREFHRTCPAIQISFLTTVTRANLADLRDLVDWGLRLEVRQFVFRQMFYNRDSNIVDHTRMPALLVSAEEFETARQRITAEFGTRARLLFLTNSFLLEAAARTRADSKFLSGAVGLMAAGPFSELPG